VTDGPVTVADPPLPPEVFRPARLGVRFARLLRRAGVGADPARVQRFVEAVEVLGPRELGDVYWAGKVVFCSEPNDFPRYDAAFATCFGLPVPLALAPAAPPRTVELTLAFDTGEEPEAGGDVVEAPENTVVVRWSNTESLRDKDFAAYTTEEFEEARRLMADLRLAGALRRSRRPVPSSKGRPHLGRTLRTALRSGGEITTLRRVGRGERPRRVVLLCDVSGSMEAYARALLRFLHAAVVGHGRVEAFTIGTRLTRITKELRSRDPDAALAAASRAVRDWSGGTRLGETLREFVDTWGQRGMARGSVVVVMSDGWDRGDPSVLATQMQRLHRLAHKVVWVNPLKATPGYAPLASGMAAALPYVDEFIEGHSLASLEELARVVAG
jgi:uncharacterized protein with von Willebrand factor type A (vWA) domain